MIAQSTIYVLFAVSGLAGLIYQVIWVRQFGQIFGNTVYSASIVVSIFMLGLGAGSYIFGRHADRIASPRRLLRLYGQLEAAIGAGGVLVSLALPRLGGVVALLSQYVTGPDGWRVLSSGSYLTRAGIALILLLPITLLMGGTLTVLVRALVQGDMRLSGWRVALLYGVNTLGAAAGALVTDFVIVPGAGLFAAQLCAAALNLMAAAGAFVLSGARMPELTGRVRVSAAHRQDAAPPAAVAWIASAMFLTGFAALGLEMIWLRHLGVLLGGFRAVFSLLMAVMLAALGVGALLGGWLDRRGFHPAKMLMVLEGAFAVSALAGLASADADAIAAYGRDVAKALAALSPSARMLSEMWFNMRPMLLEVALPALLAGVAYPLANAVVQQVEAQVGRRAGVLYAANTAGAICGSLITGYWLLPVMGTQVSAGVLAGVALCSVAPLSLVHGGEGNRPRAAAVMTALLGVGALTLWFALPPTLLVARALGTRPEGEYLLALTEGATELLAVVERPGIGRGLLTNGHAMSSTALLDQRYMRALAHIPLLAMSNPQRVLVIGFGVGNTTHAATLHDSVTRVDVVDLSTNILAHADFFGEANHGVLRDRKVTVFVNDGRQHLQMTRPGVYDLITLEPPPIALAGVAALYSREFYQLARSRLAAGGYVSQWLPAYQVPSSSSLAMVRAFVDVFPRSVLLSGTQAELILLGTTAPTIELDPRQVAENLAHSPSVRADLARVDLDTVQAIAGTFVGSADTLVRATRKSVAVTDDQPTQEYSVHSGLTAGLMGVPPTLFDLSQAAAWCPGCFLDGRGGPAAPNLDLYLGLLQQAYLTAPADRSAMTQYGQRRLLDSAYLGAMVPDTAEVHNFLGLAETRAGRIEQATREFETALRQDSRSANARANLAQIRYEQGAALLASRQYVAAIAALRASVDLFPDAAEAQNDLGVALASTGQIEEAVEHFRGALAADPGFSEAHRNLEAAEKILGR